jgi:hypothetical protein
MTEHDLSKHVLEKIKEEHIVPKPRWEFLLKDSAVWTAGVASLIIGGLAVSIIIYLTRNDDWDILREAGTSFTDALLIALPYFWIAAVAAFILVAHYNFKHTKEGYRYRIPFIVIGSVLVSVLLGVIFYDIGAGRAVDNALTKTVPPYRTFAHPRAMMWSRPEHGMIAGTIIDATNPLSFRLRDFRERTWTVRVEPPPPMIVRQGVQIRCLGRQIEPDTFEAVRIMPWEPPPSPIILIRKMDERMMEVPAY